MLGKLFKYEIKTVAKKILPFYVLIIILSGINALVNSPRLYIKFLENSLSMNVFKTLLIMGNTMVLIITGIVTFIFLLQRFNNSVYGNEGYLTNTLPVKAWEIIFVKTFSIYFWSVMSIVVTSFSILFMMSTSDDFLQLFRESLDILSYVEFDTGFMLALFYMIMAPLNFILIIYLCIGISNQFKHRVISGIISFVIITSIVSFFSSFISPNPGIFTIVTDMDNIYSLSDNPSLVIFTILTTVIYFFANKYILEKRLNLQ